MRLVVQVDGRRLVPLRAVPFVTDGLIDVITAGRMLADPELFVSLDNDSILSAYKLRSGGGVRYITPDQFIPLAKTEADETDQWLARGENAIKEAPPGVLVTAEALRGHFDYFSKTPRSEAKDSPVLDPPVWDESPDLSPKLRELVIEGLEPLYEKRRVDSIATSQAAIRAALDEVCRRARNAGIECDPASLPGTKKEFARLVKHVDPTLSRLSTDTIADYAKRVGIRWRRGSRPGGAQPLLDLFGLPPNS